VGDAHVRPATADDAAAVAALMQEAHVVHATALPDVFQPAASTVATARDVLELLARADRLVLVAVEGAVEGAGGDAADGGRAVGYAHCEIVRAPASPYKRAAAELHVHAMAVAAGARRRGVGRALMAAVRAAAAERGLRDVTLDVYAFNAAARAFYAAQGFAPLRERLSMRAGERPADGDPEGGCDPAGSVPRFR
jgi:ribosomal protein S18 acetylase RimI-like enzyme